MSNNDKLITELRRARNELCEQCGNYRDAHMGACDGCHWKEEWRGGIEEAHDALALLKAQEPRVMTLEEIQHTDAVWLETHGWKIQGGDIHETVLRGMSDFEDYVTEFVDNNGGSITCDNSTLGIDWRCWNIKPSEEQRKNTPWKEM